MKQIGAATLYKARTNGSKIDNVKAYNISLSYCTVHIVRWNIMWNVYFFLIASRMSLIFKQSASSTKLGLEIAAGDPPPQPCPSGLQAVGGAYCGWCSYCACTRMYTYLCCYSEPPHLVCVVCEFAFCVCVCVCDFACGCV